TQRADSLAKTAGELGGAGGAAPDINGKFDVYEGFAEVIAPIVSDRPFFQELQLEAGIRRSHYTIGAPASRSFNTTTWQVAVIRPSFIPGLTATVDYYNIKITDAITTPSASDVIGLCFNNVTAASATDPNCTGIRRNPGTGGLSGNPATTFGLPRFLSNQGRI